MSKSYKIKRSKYTGPIKARPNPIFAALVFVAALGLAYVGYLSFEPIYNAIMGAHPIAAPDNDVPGAAEPADSAATPAPEPEPEPETEPAILRAVYLPPSLIADSSALERFLDGLKGSSLNAVMVDIKDKSGQVLFDTQNKNALLWRTVSEAPFELDALSGKLSARGLHLIARMSAFRDEAAARADKDIAVNYRAPGMLWLDNFVDQGGKPWLNPYSPAAREYLTELALEASELGAAMVVLDDCQFPPNSLTGDAYFGETAGVSRAQTLSGFAKSFTESLNGSGAAAAIYVNVLSLAAEGGDLTAYGGSPADILAQSVLLGALPYQFGEGISSPGLTLEQPLRNPANTVKQAAGYAKELLGDARLLALIQGGNEPNSAVGYTADQITEQIAALEALEIEEFVLYCTDYSAYNLP